MSIMSVDIEIAPKPIQEFAITSLTNLRSFMSVLLLPINPSGELTRKEINDFWSKLNEQR
jgi:hypothetical protein